jgi:hypothetical protein
MQSRSKCNQRQDNSYWCLNNQTHLSYPKIKVIGLPRVNLRSEFLLVAWFALLGVTRMVKIISPFLYCFSALHTEYSEVAGLA